MALTIETPDQIDDVIRLNRDDPRMPQLRLQARQQRKRIKKLNRGSKAQTNWLLWWVRPKTRDQDFEEWLMPLFKESVGLMPDCVYRAGIEGLIAREAELPMQDNDMFSWNLDENHRVFALPNVGVIAFFAPAGNFRKAIDPNRECTTWNWSVWGTPHGLDDDAQKTEDQILESRKSLELLQSRVGDGKGRVLCIIDTGISLAASSLDGRVIARWAVEYDEDQVPRSNFDINDDDIGHGTQVATIAAGKGYGIASEAKILSIKLPMEKNGSVYEFRIAALAAAFDILASDRTPMIEKRPPLVAIDTLLLANGMYLSSRCRRQQEYLRVTQTIAAFNNAHDIVVVAAIGNQPRLASFPADEPCVLSVGALDGKGERWEYSGSGKDGTGRDIPVIHYPGCSVACQGLNGVEFRPSGTSMAAAGVAGVVTALAQTYPSSRGRWQVVRDQISLGKDEAGNLPVFQSK